MFPVKSNNKRPASRSSSSPSTVLPLITQTGLFQCYEFLAPNEYSDKTFGLLAFLVRNSVGEINFSSIMDEIERRTQSGIPLDYAKALEEKRISLPMNEASVEKCLMLNRLIAYINQDTARVLPLISDIRLDMKLKIIDQTPNQTVTYPNDFRRREQDFNHRRTAQDMRRLFYISHKESKEPPSLLHLQNRVTEHLTYIIDYKMRNDLKFRETGLSELPNILSNSFMIVSQPRFGANPVLIYDRKQGCAEYTSHPNFIDLYDIELSLWPLSAHYKLDESQTLSWKTCQIQISPDDKPHMIQYAELSSVTILPSNKNNPRMHFSETLHSLKFAIKVHVHLNEYKYSQIYQIPLESSSFVITSHHNHIPHMLSRVILDDIRRFSKTTTIDVHTIMNFLLRYFKHRTGVAPAEYLKNYLEYELKRAQHERRSFHTLEDAFLDFVIPFVHQVEFMAKHPILSMFYADGLFLGICNSDRAAECMINSSDLHAPIVDLRMNSIKIEYKSIASSPAANRSVKPFLCAVRVDIYNKRTNKFQYRTFDTNNLSNDIVKFVTTAHAEKASHIRVLANIDNSNNMRNYRLFTDFDEYYHDRLHEIYRTNEKYKPITNFILNVESGDDSGDGSAVGASSDHHGSCTPHTDLAEMFADNPYSIPPSATPSSVHDHMTYASPIRDYSTVSGVQSNSSMENISSPSNSQHLQPLSHEYLLQYTLSRPELLTEILRHVNNQTQPQQQLQSMSFPNQLGHERTYSQYQQSPIIPDLQSLVQSNATCAQLHPAPEAIPNQSTTHQTTPMSIDEDLINFDELLASPN
ncbi:unnamed protein product [Adineta ricciae]|uniref:Uncharacterized protein n=1 Tax=Adineta ricciae TaxID=249248 RepID=A0A814J4A3_ADIRI|nr:unnamed protein product [Adineta ricciae]CAF1033172.1 unnamed protein product [Adineta ricciae]